VISFQLDECASSKKLLRSCRKQGLCNVHAFPRKYKGRSIKDPELLAKFVPDSRVLVTADLAIVNQHCDCISPSNCGLVLLGPSPGSPLRTTEKLMMKMLAHFKAGFAAWSGVPWQNSIVRLTESSVEVGHISNGGYVADFYSDFSTSGWADEVRRILVINSSFTPVLPKQGN
jgi:hypothetical protein